MLKPDPRTDTCDAAFAKEALGVLYIAQLSAHTACALDQTTS